MRCPTYRMSLNPDGMINGYNSYFTRKIRQGLATELTIMALVIPSLGRIDLSLDIVDCLLGSYKDQLSASVMTALSHRWGH